MDEDWLNDPPTPEELVEDESWLNEPPTKEDLGDQGNYPQDYNEGPGQAVLNRLANSITSGLSNKATAATQAAFDKLGGESDFGPAYDKRLRYQNQRSAALRAHNPWTTGFSEAIGYAANPLSRLLPAGFLGQATAASVDRGLNSEHSPLEEPREYAVDVGLAGLTGGSVGKTAQVAAKALDKRALRQTAAESVVKAATGRNKRALKELARGHGITDYNKGINQAGTHMFDEGIVKYGDTTESLAPKLEAAMRKYGKKIGDTNAAADKLGIKISGPKMGNEMLDYATDIPENVSGIALQNRILKEAQNTMSKGDIPFSKVQGLKNNTKYTRESPDALISNADASNAIKRVYGRNLEEATERGARMGGETADLFRDYKDDKLRYSSFAPLSRASADRVAADMANRNINPSTYAVAGATAMADAAANPGSTVKSAIKGVIAGYLHTEGRNKGKTAMGLTLHKMANALDSQPFLAKYGKILADAAARGPAALLVTHRLLSKDPEYAEATN